MTGNAMLAGQALTEGVMLRRVVAWCIDAVVVAVLVCALWVVLFLFGLATLGLGFGLMAVLPAVPLAYHVLFLMSARAATPGQSMLGLVTVRDRDLGRPDVLQALLFTLGLWLTLATGALLLAVALITERHRTLHDLVSGLVVVRREALTPRTAFANMSVG
jgi:uncharacterized RDD family membrane protein YckC